MNFDLNITKLQGCLMSLENKGLLNQLGSKDAVTALRSAFCDVNKDNIPEMVFFLFLNTESEVTEQLRDDMNVGLFVGASPTLTKPFLIEMLFELGLDPYISEIIFNCPSVVILGLLEALVERFKVPGFHKKNYSEFYLHNINQAIFAKIIQNDECGVSIQKILNHFEELLALAETVIVTPMKLNDIADDMILYAGNQFLCFIKFLLCCLKMYNGLDSNWSRKEIYEISVNFNEELVENFEDVKEKLLNVLLNHSEKILKALTLDMWMSWSDFDAGDKKSLQQSVGEIIFHITVLIDDCKIKITDDLKNCLLSLKIKPETEDDIISKAEINEIISNVYDENNKWRDKWAKALINSPNVIVNEEAVMCLEKNLDVICSEDLFFLIDECLKNLGENDHVKLLLLNIFRRISLDEQVLYLEKIFKEFDYNLLKAEPVGLTEIFNKIGKGDSENFESELVSYALQAPLETVTKICELAINNTKEMDFTLSTLVKLKTVCLLENFYKQEDKIENMNLITFVLNTMIDEKCNSKEKQNLINLIEKLQNKKLIDFKFVEKIVLEIIRVEILNGNFVKVNFGLEILKSWLKLKTLDCNRIVLLAFMSQVLGHLSWDWTTFTIEKVEGRELTLSIVSLLLKGLGDVNGDKELIWIRQEILKSEKMNQVYFCDLWLKYDLCFPGGDEPHVQFLILLNSTFKLQSYLEFFSRDLEKKKLFEKRSLIILALVKILPILTAKEWISLFTHLKSIASSDPSQFQNEDINIHVLDFFVTSLYILGLLTNQNRTSFPCFEFCVRNFGRLTQEIITSKKTLGPDAYLRLLKGITFFLRGIRLSAERESCSVILSPIILNSVDSIKNNEGNVDKEIIMRWVSLLNVKDIEKAVRSRLGEGETSCLDY